MGGVSISERYRNPERLLFGLFLVSLGVICFGFVIQYQGGLFLGLALLSFGMMLAGIGLIEIVLTVRGLDTLDEDIKLTVVPASVVREYCRVRDWLVNEQFSKLRHDKRGIGWQLAVFFASIPACIFAWFVAAWPTDVVWTACTGVVTFTGPEAVAVNLVRQIVALLVGLAVFTGVIWLWVNAHRTEVNY